MAQTKEFFTRIQHKHDIETNWSKAVNFIPYAGEIIVYDKDSTHNYARIKIGDGTTKINNLPFTNTVFSVNDKTGAVKLSGYDVKAIPTFGQHNYNTDECYNAGLFMIAQGSGCPSGSQYGSLLSLPYRQANGNTIPDFGTQIYIPNGDDSTSPNSMFFRTSLSGTWNPWQEVSTVGHTHSNYAASSHNHAASEITSGTIAAARLPAATSSTLGGVKIGSNISVSNGTISLSKANVTSALGYTPPTTDTTYNVATTSANGLMSSTDKTNLNNAVSHISNTSNPHSVTKSQVGLGNVTNNQQMPIAGGTFTGNAVAYSTNRNSTCLRNIVVQNSSGTAQSTNYIIMKRK